MRLMKQIAALTSTVLIAAGLATVGVTAQTTAAPTPIGTWFGIARACTTFSRFSPPPNTINQDICKDACQGAVCPVTTAPHDEVVMMPQVLPDGIVVATDHGSLLDGHTTGQGRWVATGKVSLNGKTYDRYQASFLWWQPRSPIDFDPKNPLSIFGGAVRPRFVMYFDPANPDIMEGYIQPFYFELTDRFGITNLQPGTAFPTPDPLATLPSVCDPTAKGSSPYCTGTFMFVIRRVPVF